MKPKSTDGLSGTKPEQGVERCARCGRDPSEFARKGLRDKVCRYCWDELGLQLNAALAKARGHQGLKKVGSDTPSYPSRNPKESHL